MKIITIVLGNSQSENNSYNYTVSRTASINEITEDKPEIKKEEEISSFSTKIYTPNDQARQQNISLTCSKLNGTIVKSGETFSFCNTVGKATPEAGYQKAIFLIKMVIQ